MIFESYIDRYNSKKRKETNDPATQRAVSCNTGHGRCQNIPIYYQNVPPCQNRPSKRILHPALN